MKIGLVTSRGGHLFQLYLLKDFWNKYDRFWVTLSGKDAASLLKKEKKYYGYAPESRNLINAVKHFFLAIKILAKEKPDVVMSAGAGIGPPFLLVAKLMGMKTIYIEPYDFIHHPTWSGRLVAGWVDVMLVQHQTQLKFFKRAKYWGGMFMILVTTGTTKYPFKRMDQLVEELKQFKERIIYQSGNTSVKKGKQLQVIAEMKYDKLVACINEARIVVTHGGPATIFLAINAGKVPYVLPRQVKYYEHVDDHQLYFAKYLADNKQICLLSKPAINEILVSDKVKASSNHEPSTLVQKLHQYLENI